MLTCPFHSLTSFDCPFCGMQRSLISLFEGNFYDAFMLNPVIWCLSPYFLICAICTVGQVLKGHNHTNSRIAAFPDTRLGKWAISNSTIIVVTIILIVWCIIRNTCGLQASDMITEIQ